MHSMASPNKRFRVMVEGVDDNGSFITTFEVVVASCEDVAEALDREALSGGWRLVQIEDPEAIRAEPDAALGTAQMTGRAYFGEADS